MKQRKIITAVDLCKIVSDEKEFVEAKFGQRIAVDDGTLRNRDSIPANDQPIKFENLVYCFNELRYTFDFYHDTGTVVEVENGAGDFGYEFPVGASSTPGYGAIIPADCYSMVEKISKVRFVVPVYIQFYDQQDENHAVREEIIVLYAGSMADAKQVASLCGCDFMYWTEWDGSRNILIVGVDENIDPYQDPSTETYYNYD